MKTEKITYCVAEGETLNIFASSLAALSLRGKTIIAKFQGTVMYLPGLDANGNTEPFRPCGIQCRRHAADRQFVNRPAFKQKRRRLFDRGVFCNKPPTEPAVSKCLKLYG